MPLISVVVPVYKVEPYLRRCIDSVLAQDWKDFELILVDDGSPDRCGIICDEYAERDSRVRVIHKQNGGLSDARNAGIDAACGNYLSFVDSDDYIAPTYLSYLYALLKSAENCKVSQANHFIVREGKTALNAPGNGTAIFSQGQAFEAVLYHDRVDVSAWGKLYKRSVFDSLRFPVGKLYEDTFLFGSVLLQTPVYVYGGEAQYYYVQRKDSIVGKEFSKNNLEYIDAVNELTKIAIQVDSGLKKACDRRCVHARLSVLRYMEHCPQSYRAIRDQLRNEALELAPEVFALPGTPKRDKIALTLLRLGYFPFYKAWKLYTRFRGLNTV